MVLEGAFLSGEVESSYLHTQREALSGQAWELCVGDCLCGSIVLTAKVRPQVSAKQAASSRYGETALSSQCVKTDVAQAFNKAFHLESCSAY